MVFIGAFGMPGAAAAAFSSERSILWGGDESRIKVLRFDTQFASTAADAGNTPTTVLRRGLIMAHSSGKAVPWNPDATDGTQDIMGVNAEELRMTDYDGTAQERFGYLYVEAPVKASMLLIEGSALVGHADEYLARRRLAEIGFKLDDDPQNYKSGLTLRRATKATDYTVVASDNGTQFHAITANATFTLPAIKAGLSFDFIRMSDHNLVVTSAAGDDVVVGNDLAADSVTYSSSGNKIGARIKVTAMYVSGTLKWVAEIVPAPFSTGAFLTQTLAT